MCPKEMVRYYYVPSQEKPKSRTKTNLNPDKVMDDKFRPSKLISIFFIALLVIIHAIDMELTRHYIGNAWEREIFPPMSLSIKLIGIHASLWVSRAIMYTLIYLYFLNWKKRYWYYFLITGTILYWTAMVSWLWSLGFLTWP